MAEIICKLIQLVPWNLHSYKTGLFVFKVRDPTHMHE